MDEQLARVIRNEESIKSLWKRVDELKTLSEAIHNQGESLAVMCEQLKQQGETLKAQDTRLAALENTPKKRWESIVSAIISGVIGIIVGLLLT